MTWVTRAMYNFSEQAPLFIFLSILLALLAAAIVAYRLSAKKTNGEKRTIGNWIATLVASLVAGVITLGFGIPMLGDLRSPEVPLRDAITGITIAAVICIPAWIVAIRCFAHSIRTSHRSNEPPNA